MPSSDPRRVIQACDRVTQVLSDEFDDLNPAEKCFVLHQLAWTHAFAFDKAAQEYLRKHK